MSYDVYLTTQTIDGHDVEVFDGNMTSNCAPAWDAAGCPLRDFDGAAASTLALPARIAANNLRDKPSVYAELVKGGGQWGTTETARDFLERIADACELHPSAVVRVSR